MSKTNSRKATENTSINLTMERPRLEHHLTADQSFPSVFFRAVSALAINGGTMSLAKFAALQDVAKITENSSLAGLMLLHSLEYPIPLKTALRALQNASSTLDQGSRKIAFEAARPLIELEGRGSEKLAMQLAESLNLNLSVSDIDEFATGRKTSLLSDLARHSIRLVKRQSTVDLCEKYVLLTGDQDMIAKVDAYESTKAGEEELSAALVHACQAYASQFLECEGALSSVERVEHAVDSFFETAERLHDQVNQRLALLESRIRFERDAFSQDIDDAVHDAGNAIELEIADRFKTDNWKKTQAWESISRSQFGKELERRVDRIVSRREDILRMMKEELRLFQEDMRLTHASLLQRRHHNEFAKLMPSLRLSTRVLNSLDTTANYALGAGAISIASAGVAAYSLGAAVVFPVIAPVAPFVAGAVVVAGLFKWMTDSNQRKDKEIRQKRESFENAFRQQLSLAQASFDGELDAIGGQFAQSARQMLFPILLEADAQKQLTALQIRTARRLIDQSRKSINQLLTKALALQR